MCSAVAVAVAYSLLGPQCVLNKLPHITRESPDTDRSITVRRIEDSSGPMCSTLTETGIKELTLLTD